MNKKKSKELLRCLLDKIISIKANRPINEEEKKEFKENIIRLRIIVKQKVNIGKFLDKELKKTELIYFRLPKGFKIDDKIISEQRAIMDDPSFGDDLERMLAAMRMHGYAPSFGFMSLKEVLDFDIEKETEDSRYKDFDVENQSSQIH